MSQTTDPTKVESAKLSLFHYGGTSEHGGGVAGRIASSSFYLRRVTGGWEEDVVTWNNQPTATSVNQVTVAAPATGTSDFVDIDVTQLIKDMVEYGNYGFQLILQNETYWKRVYIGSSDNSDVANHPKLEITYTTGGNPALSAGSITPSSKTITSGESPGAISSSAAASGGAGSYSYQWEKSTNSGSSWSMVSGATSTSYTPPALTQTSWYRRKVTSVTETAYSNNSEITVTAVAGGSVTSVNGLTGAVVLGLSDSQSGTNRTINITGTGAGTTFSVADNDNSSTNEFQTLTLTGNELKLSDGGGTFTLPTSSGTADNLGNHTATQNIKLNGNWLSNDGGSQEGIKIDNLGNVCIGTSTPNRKLHVYSSGYKARFSGPDGYIDIGPGNPYWAHISTDRSKFLFNKDVYSSYGGFSSYTSTDLFLKTGGITRVKIMDATGNVGIGTADPGSYKLAVKGKIRAEEVVVETGWADFVFEPNYKLKALAEVEQFINTNGHLPDIPSEADVKENGISVGEINSKLLQKIEELTLYVIDQNKKIDSVIKENQSQKESLRELKEHFEKIN